MDKQQRSSGRNTSDTIASFLLKTYEILQHPENKKIISWDKDDIGFVVSDVISFTRQILPKYFRHSNFSSFVRQLNMYDFHKVKQENDMLVFKNPLFCRGEQQKLRFIKRKASKKIGGYRRFYHSERNTSQNEKNQTTFKWLKKSIQTQLSQSYIFQQKSIELLREHNENNKLKQLILTDIQKMNPEQCVDLLFQLRQECHIQMIKTKNWMNQHQQIFKRKAKSINGFNTQMNSQSKKDQGNQNINLIDQQHSNMEVKLIPE